MSESNSRAMWASLLHPTLVCGRPRAKPRAPTRTPPTGEASAQAVAFGDRLQHVHVAGVGTGLARMVEDDLVKPELAIPPGQLVKSVDRRHIRAGGGRKKQHPADRGGGTAH